MNRTLKRQVFLFPCQKRKHICPYPQITPPLLICFSRAGLMKHISKGEGKGKMGGGRETKMTRRDKKIRRFAEKVYREAKAMEMTLKEFRTLVGILETKAHGIQKEKEKRALAEKLQ